MTLQALLTIIAVSITFVAYVPYVKNTLSGKTKPHALTWSVWAIVSFISFGIQVTNNGGVGSLMNIFLGLLSIFVAIKGFQNGIENIRTIDYVSISISILALILWLLVDRDDISVILLILLSFFSFLPTIIKSWFSPYQETLLTWILNIIRQVITVFALSSINFLTAGYLIYTISINILFCTMIFIRRKSIQTK